MAVISSSCRLDKLKAAVEHLVDRRVGVIREVVEYLHEPGDPPLYCYLAKACNTQTFCEQRNFSDAGGVSIFREMALAKAIGEAVERYCGAIYEKDSFLFASRKEANFECIDITAVNTYSSRQYQETDFLFRPIDQNTLLRWVPALEVCTNKTKYVPAQLVYIPYSSDANEQIFNQPISTGLSCHESFEKASISSICEVIERDAFTITWQAGLSHPHIAQETLSSLNKELVRRIKMIDCKLDIMNITLDSGITTILSTLRSLNPRHPALIVATATDLDPEIAIRKSLEELAHTRRFSLYLLDHMPPVKNSKPNFHIWEQKQHLRFWCDQNNSHLAEFLFKSTQHIDFHSLKNFDLGCSQKNLKLLGEKVGGTGYHVYLCEVTTPDISSLGLHVMRALIPGYHPLRIGHRLRALGGKRLWEVPQKLGYLGRDEKNGDTDIPHPFP